LQRLAVHPTDEFIDDHREAARSTGLFGRVLANGSATAQRCTTSRDLTSGVDLAARGGLTLALEPIEKAGAKA
jgi:hypothetical protein